MVRIDVSPNGVEVLFNQAGEWRSFDRDATTLMSGQNLIVSARHVESRGDWSETWVFVLARTDANSVSATWNRVVSSYVLRQKIEQPRIFAAAGQLRRVEVVD
jgi:hypothetical protein